MLAQSITQPSTTQPVARLPRKFHVRSSRSAAFLANVLPAKPVGGGVFDDDFGGEICENEVMVGESIGGRSIGGGSPSEMGGKSGGKLGWRLSVRFWTNAGFGLSVTWGWVAG